MCQYSIIIFLYKKYGGKMNLNLFLLIKFKMKDTVPETCFISHFDLKQNIRANSDWTDVERWSCLEACS